MKICVPMKTENFLTNLMAQVHTYAGDHPDPYAMGTTGSFTVSEVAGA